MKKKSSILILICLFLSLIFVFVGISYSIFTYFGRGLTNNVIETGRIVFSYSEDNGGINGIAITDALPISDEEGKNLSNSHEYFDFSVSALTTSADLFYEIVVNKSDTSTLDEKFVKIYLTSNEGGIETPVPLTMNNNDVIKYSELKDTTNDLLEGKSIYFGEVYGANMSYSKKFRLRMWIEDVDIENFDYNLINNKEFSVKVNVAATSVR